MNDSPPSIYAEVRQAISKLLNNAPAQRQEAIHSLLTLKELLLKREYAFDIECLAYGGIITLALDSEVQANSQILVELQNQLDGRKPYWKSYLLRYDFQTVLQARSLDAYHLVRELVDAYSEQTKLQSGRSLEQERYDNELEKLFLLCHEAITPRNIADLLVSQASHTLLALPNPPVTSFNVQDTVTGFSTIYPVDELEMVHGHLDHIQRLLRKLQGIESLYVDIHILPSGLVVNVR
jgi:hypothetical protein